MLGYQNPVRVTVQTWTVQTVNSQKAVLAKRLQSRDLPFYEENVSRVCLCKTKLIYTFNDLTEAFKYMIRSSVEMP